ncbi:MAG: hypothetical protein EPO24_14010 [Bacteroidetes bacterium]|nr:MAG: hypothetical protein EPO24_14010 [Bacteroidota bacterium]
MVLQEIVEDIHALREDIEAYERKYGVLSETFYELYLKGEEPENASWILDWSDWAGAYKIWLRRKEQYSNAIEDLRGQSDSLLH